MASNTTGNKELDTYRTGELCLNAMNLAKKILSEDGVFLSKIFMGAIYNEINENAKNCFKKIVKYCFRAINFSDLLRNDCFTKKKYNEILYSIKINNCN